MDKLVIRGGTPLLGTVRTSGAKNAALPCMAAALLTDETVILENIPQVRDIETTRKLLSAMGADSALARAKLARRGPGRRRRSTGSRFEPRQSGHWMRQPGQGRQLLTTSSLDFLSYLVRGMSRVNGSVSAV